MSDSRCLRNQPSNIIFGLYPLAARAIAGFTAVVIGLKDHVRAVVDAVNDIQKRLPADAIFSHVVPPFSPIVTTPLPVFLIPSPVSLVIVPPVTVIGAFDI